MWDQHDRLEDYIDEKSCAKAIASFQSHGQMIPALGRPLIGDPDYDVELVYGARRLFAARYINVPLKVELREMTDKEAIVAMDTENRQRVDISPYERGLSFSKWLRSNQFESQDELAHALNVSPSMVCRLLRMARLPAAILDAFGDPTEIRESWGLALLDALDDAEKRPRIFRIAREIAAVSPRPAAQHVYARLTSMSLTRRKLRSRTHDEVVKSSNGVPLFRVRRLRSSIAILLPAEKVTDVTLNEIREALSVVLQPGQVSRSMHDQEVGLRETRFGIAPDEAGPCSLRAAVRIAH